MQSVEPSMDNNRKTEVYKVDVNVFGKEKRKKGAGWGMREMGGGGAEELRE